MSALPHRWRDALEAEAGQGLGEEGLQLVLDAHVRLLLLLDPGGLRLSHQRVCRGHAGAAVHCGDERRRLALRRGTQLGHAWPETELEAGRSDLAGLEEGLHLS